jgi:PTH1 family peptidyl-tRNA hydrolase
MARSYGISPDRILVIADDLDLEVGVLRLREGGSAGGHNGHKSLIQSLGTQDYPRIKIGIGKASGGQTIDHVLSTFTPPEKELVIPAIRGAAETAEALVDQGIVAAQSVIDQHNKNR